MFVYFSSISTYNSEVTKGILDVNMVFEQEAEKVNDTENRKTLMALNIFYLVSPVDEPGLTSK